jgi:hypothetical protein
MNNTKHITTDSSTAKHTPTPWQQHDPEYCPEEIWGNLEGPLEDGKIHGTHICTLEDNEQAEANARHIVRCVNSHDDLLEALELLVSLDGEWSNDGYAKAESAIAKAKSA